MKKSICFSIIFFIIIYLSSSVHSHGQGTVWGSGLNNSCQLGFRAPWVPLKVNNETTWKSVVCGQNYTIALKKNGTLWAWGTNTTGWLGLGNNTDQTTPVQIGSDNTWDKIFGSSGTTFAIKKDGSLWGWGRNMYGELGDGTKYHSRSPIRIGSDNDWAFVSCGGNFSVGLKSNGTLWSWGSNSSGRLGDGTNKERLEPGLVGIDQDWQSVSAGGEFVMAIKQNGTLWGWGNNTNGQLGDGTTTSQMVAVQIGTDNNWKYVHSADYYSLAIKQDGTLWGWGQGDNHVFGKVAGTQLNPIKLGTDKNWKSVNCTAFNNVLALKTDNSLWGWGYCKYGSLANQNPNVDSLRRIGNTKDWAQVDIWTHTMAIKTDGTLWAWGDNSYGEFGDGTTNIFRNFQKSNDAQNWIDVKAGDDFSFGLKEDGTIWSWGVNRIDKMFLNPGFSKDTIRMVGTDKDWMSIACAETLVTAIKKDGTLWDLQPFLPGYLTDNVKVVSHGYDHSVAIKKDGTLWTWGINWFGQLGDDTPQMRREPAKIGKDNDWEKVSCGPNHTFAIKTNGTLWTWGMQPNAGMGEDKKAIAQFGNDTNWKAISAGYNHNLALKNDGTLWAWGSNKDGILGDGTTNDTFVPIQIGTDKDWKLISTRVDYNLAAKNDGSLWAWGSNKNGQLGIEDKEIVPVPTKVEGVYNIIQLACGRSHSLVLVQNKISDPVLQTKAIVNVTSNSAESGGIVTSDGLAMVYERGICWSKKPNPKSSDSRLKNGSGEGNYDCTMENLTPFTKYYVRAYATNTNGTLYGQEETFVTKLITPILLAPEDNTAEVPTDVDLLWNKSKSAFNYRVQISDNPTFATLVSNEITTDTTYDYSKYEPNSQYFWRVQALNGKDSSDWSPVWSFTTSKNITQSLVSPADNSKNIPKDCQLNWKHKTSNGIYRLQVSKNLNFDDLVINTSLADTFYVSSELDYYNLYYWRVRVVIGEDSSEWSPIWNFNTRISNALLVYPADTQTGLPQEINFKWNPVIGGEYYHLQVSKNDIFTELVYSKDSITDTEHFVPNLEKEVLYYWRVKVWNTESIASAYWSVVWTFTTSALGVKNETDLIMITPNPAGDFITIALKPSKGSEIQIYNTLGEKVMSESINPMTASHRMNIEKLPKGIYFVKVGDETAKFVKL